MTVTKGLAWTGFLVLSDDKFYAEVGRFIRALQMPTALAGQMRDEFQRTLGALGAR